MIENLGLKQKHGDPDHVTLFVTRFQLLDVFQHVPVSQLRAAAGGGGTRRVRVLRYSECVSGSSLQVQYRVCSFTGSTLRSGSGLYVQVLHNTMQIEILQNHTDPGPDLGFCEGVGKFLQRETPVGGCFPKLRTWVSGRSVDER